MQELTKRQQEILRMIQSHIDRTGFPPTRTDICDHFGFRSPTAADDHLKALERKEAIELIPGTSRGIRILVDYDNADGVPLIGKVAAGEPITSEANIEEYLPVDPDLFYPHADYMLRVNGNSMRDIGIINGDLLAVHSTEHVQNNQIVVARVNDDVTVKRYRKRGNIVTLLPENDDFEPIRVDLREDDFAIEGVYVGVLRRDS
ncbi:MAG: transcriptional repressor LexA [Granulosicoccus sp.]